MHRLIMKSDWVRLSCEADLLVQVQEKLRAMLAENLQHVKVVI